MLLRCSCGYSCFCPRGPILTWGLYLLVLVVSTAIVFTKVGDCLDRERFPGPNGLKMTLCITPLLVLLLLLLLLLNTAKDVKGHEELLPLLCFQMAVDLVDTIEIIGIVLDRKQYNYGIPNAFGHTMVAIACISFLLSLWKMLEIDLNTGKRMQKRALLRYVFEMSLVNLVFLIIRSVIFTSTRKMIPFSSFFHLQLPEIYFGADHVRVR